MSKREFLVVTLLLKTLYMNKLYILTLLALSIVSTAIPQDWDKRMKHLPVSSKSDRAKSQYYEAIDLIANSHQQEAYQTLHSAIQIEPELFMAHAYLAFFEAREKTRGNGSLDRALALYDPANKTPAEEKVYMLLKEIKSGTYANIVPLCDELVEEYNYVIGAYELASFLTDYLLNDIMATIGYKQELVDRFPEYGPGYNLTGHYYLHNGETEKAREAFEKYINYTPNESNAYFRMGEYYQHAGNYELSAENFERASDMGMDISSERAANVRNMALAAERENLRDNE